MRCSLFLPPIQFAFSHRLPFFYFLSLTVLPFLSSFGASYTLFDCNRNYLFSCRCVFFLCCFASLCVFPPVFFLLSFCGYGALIPLADFDRYLNLCNLLCHNANKTRNKMELHTSLSLVHVEHMKIGMSRAQRERRCYFTSVGSRLIGVHRVISYCIRDATMEACRKSKAEKKLPMLCFFLSCNFFVDVKMIRIFLCGSVDEHECMITSIRHALR